jgi:hypothetical protein
MAMPGGLNSPMTFPQQPQQQPQPQPQPQTATADPYPGMAMPGGLNSPMTMPQPQSTPASPFDVGTSPISGTEFAGPYGGGLGVGGLDWGGLQGATYQPPAEPNRYQTVGPQATSSFDRYFDVTSANDPERFLSQAEGRPQLTGGSEADKTAGGALTPGGGLPAADLMAQARDRLAKLMGTPEGPPAPPQIPEPPADAAAIPLPRRRPDEAPDRVEPADMSTAGKVDTLRNTLKQELAAQDLVMTSDYRGPGHELYRPGSQHSDALAFDTRAHTPAEADTAMNKIRELFGARGMTEGRGGDYFFIDEARNPIPGITQGAHLHTTLTPQGMEKYQEQAYQDPYPNAPRPPGDIPGTAAPFPARPEGPVEWDPNAPRPPADIPVNDVRSDVIAPPAEPVPLPTARPNAAANLAQAHSVLDSNVGDLVRKNSPDNADRVPSSIASQTLREALGNAMTGGMIRSGIGPYLPQLGITQADFNKAIAQGQLASPPRFGAEEAGPPQAGAGTRSPDYWDIPKAGTPEWNAGIYEPMVGSGVMQRPENQTIGGASSYADFTRSGNVEDRRTEFLNQDQLAALKARGFSYYTPPYGPAEPSTPLGAALGLGDLPVPTGSAATMSRPHGIAGDGSGSVWDRVALPGGMPSSQDLLGYTPQQWPDEAYPASFNDRFTGDSTAPSSMRDFQSPANDYSTFQQIPQPAGPTMPSWQSSIPATQRNADVVKAIQSVADRFNIPPEAIASVGGLETGGTWNPRSRTGTQAGAFQIAPADFKTAGGTLGGLTYDQYRRAPLAQQIAAYGDYIASSPNAGYLRGVQDPALAASLLQGIQFAPQSTTWSERMLIGDTGTPVRRQQDQARELGNTSIDAMRDAMARRIAGWPQTQSLLGGR